MISSFCSSSGSTYVDPVMMPSSARYIGLAEVKRGRKISVERPFVPSMILLYGGRICRLET